jgi:hypothetical protein
MRIYRHARLVSASLPASEAPRGGAIGETVPTVKELAETFVDCDSRGMFQNSGEFAELYPDDVPVPWAFCAPRVEAGSADLAAIRAVLSERAEALAYELSDATGLRPITNGDAEEVRSLSSPPRAWRSPRASAELKLAS